MLGILCWLFDFAYFIVWAGAWIAGIYTLIHCSICFSAALVRNYVRKELDLQTRYGKGSWCVVTGATGGIGEAYCHQLAKRNFNIVLFGRNKENLAKIEAELNEKYKNIKTRIVVADLGESLQPEFYEDIYAQIKDLDISILVNNAGAANSAHFHMIPAETHLANLRTNTGAPAMLTHTLINQLLKRPTRSAIINVSSTGHNSPIPYLGVYPATKRFLTFFSYGLHDNYKHKIDVQNLTPGWVSTKMSGFRKTPDTITPDECVRASLRDLGYEVTSMYLLINIVYSFTSPCP